MQITSFKLSQDKDKFLVTIIDAAGLVSLRLWTENTYKDFASFVDLTSKLTGAATETLEITPSDLNLAIFDGVYFLEAENLTSTAIEIASNLARFKECIIEGIIETHGCDDCLDAQNKDLQNAHTLLKSLEYAIQLRFVDEVLSSITTLKKYCSNACKSCGKYNNVTDTISYENTNPDFFNVIIDGGDID